MAAFTDMTLNDGQATPVAHTFKARRIDGIVGKYQDISGGIAIGYPTITLSTREPVRNSDIYKVTSKITLPVLETISGSSYAGIVPAPQLAYNCGGNVEFLLPARSTQAVRKDLLAYTRNLLAHAVLMAMVHDLDMVA